MKLIITPLILLLLGGCAATTPPASGLSNTTSAATAASEQQIHAVLQELHRQASNANFAAYFDLYTDNAVFLGTDKSEYWPIKDFRAYAKPHFDKGNGWTYVSTERKVHVFENTAWFEERLQHERYGEVRGTGVLILSDGQWKVAQYNLSLPVPNALFGDVVDDIRAFYRTSN